MIKTITSSLFFLMIMVSSISAQDIHFSQFYNSPLNINPALAGVFKEDIRFIGNYRSQWQSVPVPYLTFSGAYDRKFLNFKLGNGFFAGGLIFNIDKAGQSELSISQLSLAGSYTLQLNDLNFLTAGFSFGGTQRSFTLNGLTFHNQFDGEIYNENLSSRENFSNERIFYTDFSAGLNYHLQLEDQKGKLDFGAAIFHINKPVQSFDEEKTVRLPFRIPVYLMGLIEMNEKMDLRARVIVQKQGAYFETVAGMGVKYNLSKQRGKELAIEVGTNYRLNKESDAVIPTIQFYYLAWQLGLSYDINISEFAIATNRKGGPELALIYTITKVKPVKAFKACPIF